MWGESAEMLAPCVSVPARCRCENLEPRSTARRLWICRLRPGGRFRQRGATCCTQPKEQRDLACRKEKRSTERRRAAQTISDYLLDLGPEPGSVLAREQPGFGIKKIMRRGLDLAPPNWLVDFGLTFPGAKSMARRVYFHRRGNAGIGFQDFHKQRANRLKPTREI